MTPSRRYIYLVIGGHDYEGDCEPEAAYSTLKAAKAHKAYYGYSHLRIVRMPLRNKTRAGQWPWRREDGKVVGTPDRAKSGFQD